MNTLDLPPPAVLADPEARNEAFVAALADENAALALAIAREPLPADWPEDARRKWGARRDLARMALDGRAEIRFEGFDE